MRWRERLAREPQDAATRRAAMQAANPAYIPRNHRVEAALAAAVERDDFAPFEELLKVLARPFEERPEFAAYAEPPAGRPARLPDLLRHLKRAPPGGGTFLVAPGSPNLSQVG